MRAGRLAVTVLAAVGVLAAPAEAQDATRPWVLASPIFTPKTGTSFTLLMTSSDSQSRSMLMRRYDAVGTLLTSQAITIGAKGSLQASPAAHSGAPLHVELWTAVPGITALVTYTDASDVARRIEPGDMLKTGPTDATVASVAGDVTALSGTVGNVASDLTALTPPIDAMTNNISSLQSVLGGVDTKIGALDGKVSALSPATTESVTGLDAKVVTLQRDVTRLRAGMRSLRRLVKRALARR